MKKNLNRRDFIRRTALSTAVFSIVPSYVTSVSSCTKPSDKIGLGFIGTGRQAPGLRNNFLKFEDVQLIAACDVHKIKLDRFALAVNEYYAKLYEKPEYNAFDTYVEYEELISRKDIDAVVVATPDHWHAIISIEAMKKGKDVYCEKPLAHTVFEGRQMVNAVNKYKRVLQTGSMQRSDKNFRHACELVRNGYIGDISQVLVSVGDPAKACDLPAEPQPDFIAWDRWVGPAGYREFNEILAPPLSSNEWPRWRLYQEFGGGILADWGAHMFDIAQWGLGMDNSGPTQLIPPKDPDAVRGLRLIYKNGIEVIHENFGRGWGVRFIGSKGSLDISRSYLDSNPENLATTEIKESDTRLYESSDHQKDFLDAMKNRSKPICDVETGHRSASICNIGNIAYRLGRSLEWDPEKEQFMNDNEANKLLTRDYRAPYILDV